MSDAHEEAVNVESVPAVVDEVSQEDPQIAPRSVEKQPVRPTVTEAEEAPGRDVMRRDIPSGDRTEERRDAAPRDRSPIASQNPSRRRVPPIRSEIQLGPQHLHQGDPLDHPSVVEMVEAVNELMDQLYLPSEPIKPPRENLSYNEEVLYYLKKLHGRMEKAESIAEANQQRKARSEAMKRLAAQATHTNAGHLVQSAFERADILKRIQYLGLECHRVKSILDLDESDLHAIAANSCWFSFACVWREFRALVHQILRTQEVDEEIREIIRVAESRIEEAEMNCLAVVHVPARREALSPMKSALKKEWVSLAGSDHSGVGRSTQLVEVGLW